jgi:predicted CXXCH cytochrome family protein
MNRSHRLLHLSVTSLLTFVFVALATAACTDIVYRDREAFNPPPDSVAGFLGYFDIATKQTTCGNCHVGHQAQWATAKHASAWSDLQASGHAAESCNGCHSVSELGNAAAAPGGYNKVADSAYHDVQCENCHGPGLKHVTNPEVKANVPLASFNADTALKSSCSGCHTGTHEPFVEQWKESAHGSGPAWANEKSNASCQPCHEGRAALSVKFGVATNYLERDSATSYQRITCVVCHDPHGSTFAGQLRRDVAVPTTDNLCVTCHSRTGVPPWGTATATSSARGPHGAQGLLVIGQNVGWIPDNFVYDTSLIVSSHGTTANPRLCATCHMSPTTVTDKATGAFTFQSVGHLFEAIPCLDAAGKPVGGGTCTLTERDFSACASSGCHTSAGSARTAYNAYQSRVDNLLDQIWDDKNKNGVVDASPTDGGLIAQMVFRNSAPDIAALNFGSSTMTVAKGTIWNAALAANDDRAYFLAGKVYGKGWAAHASSGNGVHNPFLLEALLTASIAQLKTTYGFPAPPMPQTVQSTVPPGVRLRTR